VPRVMSAVNDLLARDLAEDRFVTCFLGAIDPAGPKGGPPSAALTFASAGHGPIVFYDRAADRFDELPATTMPMGIFGGIRFDETVRRELKPGDFAAILTDGLFEAPRAGGHAHGRRAEQFGIRRLCELMRASRDAPVREMLNGLRAAVAEWTANEPQADDLTGVIVRRRPAP